jgi:hypothetical protein
MGPQHSFMAAAMVLASWVASAPVTLLGTESMSATEIGNVTWTVDRHMLAAFECLGQSCLIADTAGSTGREPTIKAEGPSDSDIACIVKHNPVIGELLKKYDNKVPDVPKQDTGIMSTLIGGINTGWRPIVTATGSTVTGKFNGTCAKNILIFAKGTLEPGAYGIVVGPSFTSGLPKDWSTHGVPYDPDVPGDYCLGLPGGMVAKDVINQAHEKCPDSNLFVSGYSQGAMVVRNGLARATDSARRAVKVYGTTLLVMFSI